MQNSYRTVKSHRDNRFQVNELSIRELNAFKFRSRSKQFAPLPLSRSLPRNFRSDSRVCVLTRGRVGLGSVASQKCRLKIDARSFFSRSVGVCAGDEHVNERAIFARHRRITANGFDSQRDRLVCPRVTLEQAVGKSLDPTLFAGRVAALFSPLIKVIAARTAASYRRLFSTYRSASLFSLLLSVFSSFSLTNEGQSGENSSDIIGIF